MFIDSRILVEELDVYTDFDYNWIKQREISEKQTAALVPELVGSHLAQLVELDFFGEDIERDIDRTA